MRRAGRDRLHGLSGGQRHRGGLRSRDLREIAQLSSLVGPPAPHRPLPGQRTDMPIARAQGRNPLPNGRAAGPADGLRGGRRLGAGEAQAQLAVGVVAPAINLARGSVGSASEGFPGRDLPDVAEGAAGGIEHRRGGCRAGRSIHRPAGRPRWPPSTTRSHPRAARTHDGRPSRRGAPGPGTRLGSRRARSAPPELRRRAVRRRRPPSRPRFLSHGPRRHGRHRPLISITGSCGQAASTQRSASEPGACELYRQPDGQAPRGSG